MPLISSELAQSIGTITLDNPAKRNALCTTLVGETDKPRVTSSDNLV
jgi:enoyl-CoA hydratase/carnithine racemase